MEDLETLIPHFLKEAVDSINRHTMSDELRRELLRADFNLESRVTEDEHYFIKVEDHNIFFYIDFLPGKIMLYGNSVKRENIPYSQYKPSYILDKVKTWYGKV